MGWFRSEEMEYVQVIVHENSAHRCIAQLGGLGSIQFTDRNAGMTAMARCKTHRIFEFFLKEIRACDDLERTLRYFESEMQKFGIEAARVGTVEQFLDGMQGPRRRTAQPQGAAPGGYAFDELKIQLEQHKQTLENLNAFSARLTQEMNERIEFKHVLRKCSEFYRVEMMEGNELALHESKNDVQSLLDQQLEREVKLRLVTGVVARDDIVQFTRLAFRATRGNCYTHFAEVDEAIVDPDTEQEVEKSVFIVLFHSERVEAKLAKICEAFGARRYAVPDMENSGEIGSLIRDTAIEIEDRRQVIGKNRDKRRALLQGKIARHAATWEWQLKREKAIYHTLNMFTPNSGGLMSFRCAASVEHLSVSLQEKKKREGAQKKRKGLICDFFFLR